MSQAKLTFEQFLDAVESGHQSFIIDLNNYFTENGCKATFEEKKSGLLASYKHSKTKKSVINVLFRKEGMFVRIYGEHVNNYLDFLDTLPKEMIDSIRDSGVCKRIVFNTCSPKCIGYDVKIHGEHFQKCRYGGFQFLVTETNKPFIKEFIENELLARLTGK